MPHNYLVLHSIDIYNQVPLQGDRLVQARAPVREGTIYQREYLRFDTQGPGQTLQSSLLWQTGRHLCVGRKTGIWSGGVGRVVGWGEWWSYAQGLGDLV